MHVRLTNCPRSLKAAVGLIAALALTSAAAADDWPQWLGPQRDGVWREDGVLVEEAEPAYWWLSQ